MFPKKERQRCILSEGLENRVLLSGSNTPELIRDINQTSDMMSPEAITQVGGVGYFAGRSSIAEDRELWRTDGTAAGTVPVKEIFPGASGSSPRSMVDVNGTLFFLADDATTGGELWKSDGTEAGTVRVKDIRVGTSSSSLGNLINVNGTLYFVANDGSGTTVWRSNGTEAGTMKVPVAAGSPSITNPTNLVNYGGTLMFSAGARLYTVAAGGSATVLNHSLGTLDPRGLTVFGGFVYFTDTSSLSGMSRGDLYRTDGTSVGTTRIKSIDISGGISTDFANSTSFAVSGGLLYFIVGNISNAQYNVWRSDGTTAGTFALTTSSSLSGSSVLQHFTPVGSNSVLFLNSTPATGTELWISDGTGVGTKLLKEITPGTTSGFTVSVVGGLKTSNGRVVFTPNPVYGNGEVWSTDGTVAGTSLLKNLSEVPGVIYPLGLLNGVVMLNGTAFIGGGDLYRSDGTAAGTYRVGSSSMLRGSGMHDGFSTPAFIVVGSTVYFAAQDGISGRELWRTDGVLGAVQVANLAPGGIDSNPSDFVVSADGTLYFTATTPAFGEEVYKLAPGAGAPVMLPEVFAGAASSGPAGLQTIGNLLYFRSYDSAVSSYYLWRYNPATNQTTRVTTSNNLNFGSPTVMRKMGSHWYFGGRAEDANRQSTTGAELWRVDESSNALAQLVSDLQAGTANSNPTPMGAVGTKLIFAATTTATGMELFWTDGTPAGTSLLANLSAGTASTDFSLSGWKVSVEAGNQLYFGAALSGMSSQLYRATDTGAVSAITTGGPINGPGGYSVLDGSVFVTGTDASGSGVFRIDGTQATRVMSAGTGEGTYVATALHVAGEKVYVFRRTGVSQRRYELWRTDAAGNAALVTELGPFVSSVLAPEYTSAFYGAGNLAFASTSSHLYFPMYTTNKGVEPYRLELASPLPEWLDPASDASWDESSQTLTVNGSARITSDPADAVFSDSPIINLDGDDELIIDTGAGGARTISLQELNLSGNARFEFAAASSSYVLTVGVLSINNTAFLDLDDNALIVTSSTVSAVEAQVASGFNFFAWDGPGIRSTASLNDPNNFTTLGVLDGATYAAINGSSFGGRTVADTDVLVKYTYYGDADLSGVVDGTDYALIDTGFANQLSGWFNGDFDHSGTVDGTDYALIDTVYVNQVLPMGYSFGINSGLNSWMMKDVDDDGIVDAADYALIDP